MEMPLDLTLIWITLGVTGFLLGHVMVHMQTRPIPAVTQFSMEEENLRQDRRFIPVNIRRLFIVRRKLPRAEDRTDSDEAESTSLVMA